MTEIITTHYNKRKKRGRKERRKKLAHGTTKFRVGLQVGLYLGAQSIALSSFPFTDSFT